MTRTLAIAMVMIATLQAAAPYVGRPLVEVLGELQAGGLKIVYSSEDRKSTRLNSSHLKLSRMPSSA